MPRQLLAAYPFDTARFDEMFEGRAVRSHWQGLWETLIGTTPEQMRRQLEFVGREIRENGVTYNVYADPRGADRPWELDPLPMMVSQDEWRTIEAAVVQRAELLNRILADVYGPQHLLKEGLLPPALVYGHPGFLRACHGVAPPGGVHLHFYAADLARSPDGRWWFMADRTQAPSGAGYALENRLIVSRVFPDLFRELRVTHLAQFFRTLRDSLSHWSPRTEEVPRIVLLTSGPRNEAYFEHAYLARYLGFPLVEGPDLTVREGCVWLKSLDGLQRVHAILRRVDDDLCDPLELRSDSALGIPGLTQAARLGNVLVANALGTGVLESGALLGYLPRLCERLLGRPLALPSVATWWCGEPAALDEAIRHIERVVVKPAFPGMRIDPVFGRDLDGPGREALVAALRADPQRHVAQEWVPLAQAPVWDRTQARRLGARCVGLRLFACASPDGYVVMPGGLTRVAGSVDARILSTQRGGSSKDTWVLSGAPVSGFSLLRRPVGPQDIVRSGANLSSRTVENLYWLGRYSERADNTTRLLRLTLGRLVEDDAVDRPQEWQAVLGLCGRLELLPLSTAAVGIDARLRAAVLDEAMPASLASVIRQLFRVAFQLRERLSGDNWRTINRLAQDLTRRQQNRPGMGEIFAYLERNVGLSMTLSGFALDGMVRDMGWRFMSMGRRLERLQFLCAGLQHALAVTAQGELDWLLECADSIITYRSRYMRRPEPLPVFDLLLLDRDNPRSVVFQLYGLHDYLRRVGAGSAFLWDASIAPVWEPLQALDLAAALEDPTRLSALLAAVSAASARLSDLLTQHCFTHVGEAQRQTASM